MSAAIQQSVGQEPWEHLLRKLSVLNVEIPEPEEMHGYLKDHLDMADVVLEVSARARREFGVETELSLEAYSDPEIEDRYLTLYVRPSFYDATLLDRIHALCDAVDEPLSNASGWLLVTSDFRPAGFDHGI